MSCLNIDKEIEPCFLANSWPMLLKIFKAVLSVILGSAGHLQTTVSLESPKYRKAHHVFLFIW